MHIFFTDDASRQKVALHLLVVAMKSTTNSPLHFLYQEYEVSLLLCMCLMHESVILVHVRGVHFNVHFNQ